MTARILQFFRAFRRACDPLLPMMVAAQMVASPPVHGAESIVGTWAPIGGECTPVGGMLDVGQKSMTADDLACKFDDVVRQGDRITWHGHCSDGSQGYPATVVAPLYQRRLTVSVNGNGWTKAFTRCR